MAAVRQHEVEITSYALARLRQFPGIELMGPADAELRGGVAAFRHNRLHPHDLADFLGEQNVSVRAGFHCAQPVHTRFGGEPSTRASFYIYTEPRDVDAMIDALHLTVATLLRKPKPPAGASSPPARRA